MAAPGAAGTLRAAGGGGGGSSGGSKLQLLLHRTDAESSHPAYSDVIHAGCQTATRMRDVYNSLPKSLNDIERQRQKQMVLDEAQAAWQQTQGAAPFRRTSEAGGPGPQPRAYDASDPPQPPTPSRYRSRTSGGGASAGGVGGYVEHKTAGLFRTDFLPSPIAIETARRAEVLREISPEVAAELAAGTDAGSDACADGLMPAAAHAKSPGVVTFSKQLQVDVSRLDEMVSATVSDGDGDAGGCGRGSGDGPGCELFRSATFGGSRAGGADSPTLWTGRDVSTATPNERALLMMLSGKVKRTSVSGAAASSGLSQRGSISGNGNGGACGAVSPTGPRSVSSMGGSSRTDAGAGVGIGCSLLSPGYRTSQSGLDGFDGGGRASSRPGTPGGGSASPQVPGYRTCRSGLGSDGVGGFVMHSTSSRTGTTCGGVASGIVSPANRGSLSGGCATTGLGGLLAAVVPRASLSGVGSPLAPTLRASSTNGGPASPAVRHSARGLCASPSGRASPAGGGGGGSGARTPTSSCSGSNLFSVGPSRRISMSGSAMSAAAAAAAASAATPVGAVACSSTCASLSVGPKANEALRQATAAEMARRAQYQRVMAGACADEVRSVDGARETARMVVHGALATAKDGARAVTRGGQGMSASVAGLLGGAEDGERAAMEKDPNGAGGGGSEVGSEGGSFDEVGNNEGRYSHGGGGAPESPPARGSRTNAYSKSFGARSSRFLQPAAGDDGARLSAEGSATSIATRSGSPREAGGDHSPHADRLLTSFRTMGARGRREASASPHRVAASGAASPASKLQPAPPAGPPPREQRKQEV